MIAYNIVFSVLYCFCIAKADCFLQLNGYKADKNFFKYFKTDFSAFAIVFSVISVLFYIVFEAVWLYVHAGLTILLGVKYLTEKKKTPLRMTARMTRLYLTQWVLLLLLSFLFNPTVFVLLPFVALFANAVNGPAEICVQAKYMQKAKLKLAGFPDMKIIAITGSYGKTSVKNILTELLSQKYKVVKTPASFNTPMGIVKTINQTDLSGADFFVCEMGARRMGDIAELCRIAKPDVAVITGIAPQHMDTFKSVENILSAKFEIAVNAKPDALVFLNHDSPYLQKPPAFPQKIYFSGGDKACDFSYANVILSKEGSVFTIKRKNQKIACETKLLGRHNVSNICLCAAVGQMLGLNAADIKNGVKNLQFIPHRLQLMEGQNGLYILDDSYNANINGVEESLKVLKCFDGQKFVIACGIVDAGKQTQSLNIKVGEMLAEACDYAMLVGVNSGFLEKGLQNKGFLQSRIFKCVSTQDAVERLGGFAKSGDVVLFSNDLPDNIL